MTLRRVQEFTVAIVAILAIVTIVTYLNISMLLGSLFWSSLEFKKIREELIIQKMFTFRKI